MFSKFEDIVDNRHEQAKGIKARGKELIGYLCSYVPEELIYAAGAVPVRLISSKEPPTLADSHLQSYYCAFARSILHQGLKGEYGYLDGLVHAYSCPTMLNVFESWELNSSLPLFRFLPMPSIIDTPESKQWLVSELRRFRQDLEEAFGRTISDDDIHQAIRTYDTDRSLVMQLFEFRKLEDPLLTGKEAYAVTLSGMLCDKDEHSALLTKVLTELPNRPKLPPALGRLMIVGSPMDNLDLLSLVEDEMGAAVVTDDTCTGTRYYYGTTSSLPDGDPIEAIADRYLLGRAPCPGKHSATRWMECSSCPYRAVECFLLEPAPRGALPADISLSPPQRICRFRHMLQLAASHKVEGVLVIIQKFCDAHGFDYPHVAQLFKHVGVPTLLVDVENVISPGQIGTRVQAFLEMLQPVEYLIEAGILPEVG